VAGDYFRALGVSIMRGRAFAETDTADGPKVASVNGELVRRLWKQQDPIGKVISVNPPVQLLPSGAAPPGYEPTLFTVVGVVADVHYGSLSAAALPLVYVPFAQGSEGTTTMYLVARAGADPVALAGTIRDRIRQVGPDVPASSILTMEERVSASLAQPRLQTMVLGAFALLAFLLAGVGTYGACPMRLASARAKSQSGWRSALARAPS
jgi:MacB-like periplasmic core domain